MTSDPISRLRHLLPLSVRRAGSRLVAARRASGVERQLECLARGDRPIVLGPWLGEVGFELLYWVPFLRWFADRYSVAPERLIGVSRGGGADAWYAPFVSRTYDALTFISADDFRRKNAVRSGTLGEQKQTTPTPLEAEVLDRVRGAEGRDLGVLHPAAMYRLFAPYWWGHQPIDWVRRYQHFVPLRPPTVDLGLPAGYTAVKFYFNDCFRNTADNRAFVERTIRRLADEGPVVSVSTGVAVDDHVTWEPDVAALRRVGQLRSPEHDLVIQSAIVAGARRFVGTYGGFAYLAPLCGVPALSYYTEPGAFSTRHLDLMRDVLLSQGVPELFDLVDVRRGAAA